jgi:hypothetical protein
VIGRLTRKDVDKAQGATLSEPGIKTRRVRGVTIIETVGRLSAREERELLKAAATVAAR